MTDNTDPKVTRAADKVVDAAADAIKTAAKATNTTEPAPKKAGTKPKAYVNNEGPVYVDDKYYKAGEVFVTAQPKGEGWDEVAPKEAAAITASTDRVPDGANLEEADTAALQAVAILKHVNISGIAKDRKALIGAIQAAYEPKL